MAGLGFSHDAIELLGKLGHTYDPNRADSEYIEELFEIVGDEDTRIAFIALDLEEKGMYPYGLSPDDSHRLSLCTEMLNKLADATRFRA